MDIQNGDANHVSEKPVSNVLRRKGVISKRKKPDECRVPSSKRENRLNLWKTGKMYGKRVMNLVFHHPRSSIQEDPIHPPDEYEFSCSNSPVPFHMQPKIKRILCFPCIRPTVLEDDNEEKMDDFLDPNDLPSPLLTPLCRTILCSPVDHDQVDMQAEKFIAKFYQQLRDQESFLEYQEMLERGSS